MLVPTSCFSSTQEPTPKPQSKGSQSVDSSRQESPFESILEAQKKRLAEINGEIIDLERKYEETASRRSALQTERSTLITAISRGEAEREFKNSPGYLVTGVANELTVTLLMHGHEKDFRLIWNLRSIAAIRRYFIPQKRACQRESVCSM